MNWLSSLTVYVKSLFFDALSFMLSCCFDTLFITILSTHDIFSQYYSRFLHTFSSDIRTIFLLNVNLFYVTKPISYIIRSIACSLSARLTYSLV
ncbi:hypothetical protein EUBDOL_00524 [Amedibacillus dolichus DSM 3991]|uniref:Uncharacterized protein n=1 Tax=Amedibacillus dolichus DSM 3991 TaxID=428127 RepID=A8R9C5_9FIRM|nr:hypothetical protein EUBDOL_00524 [Amedibacillus dolichus DSM 3991]